MKQRGLALVLVLLLLGVMSIMAGSFALTTRREAALLTHAHERARAVALADGAVYLAMLMLSLPDAKERWRSDGREYLWPVDEGQVRIRIFDESGKIDLNLAQEPTLRALLGALLGDEEQAERLTDAILDWRDPDDLKRIHGAERVEYEAAGLPQRPQNRNFISLDELRGVLGVNGALYRRLEPLLTIYSGNAGVNPLKASRELLLVLTQGDAALIDAYVAARETDSPQPLPPIPGVQFAAGGEATYSIRAQAEFPGQNGAVVEAVIRRGLGPDGGPFTFLRWRAHTGVAPAAAQP